jgi:hypothetical protein
MDHRSCTQNINLRKLNRFTNLPILLDILKRKKIFIPNYMSWEDKNDTEVLDYYLEKMKRIDGTAEVHVLCFTHDDETIHHWNYFSNGMSGCCIEFDYVQLTQSFIDVGGFDHGIVEYYKINDLEKGRTPILSQLPFAKRWPYRVEHEYRFVHKSKKKIVTLEVPINLKSINKITISQKLPDAVSDTIKQILGEKVDIVNHSTVLKNKKWLRLVKEKHNKMST